MLKKTIKKCYIISLTLSPLLDESYSHEVNARADVDDCTIVFVTLDGNVVAYDGWKGRHIWSLETGGQLLSSSVPTENLQGYGSNINGDVSHSSSMIVPAVDGSIFSIHANENTNINEGKKYVANPNANNDPTGSLMSSYSSPKLKLHRLPVSAQDIVLQPFLVQSGKAVDIEGDIVDTPEADPALLHGDKASKVFVLDLRSGKIKDGTQNSENAPGSAAYEYQDEIDSVDLDDNDACYSDYDPDSDESRNDNEREYDPLLQRCKADRSDGDFAHKDASSSRTLLLTRTDFLVRAINTRRGSEMWNASVGRIDIVSPRMKMNRKTCTLSSIRLLVLATTMWERFRVSIVRRASFCGILVSITNQQACTSSWEQGLLKRFTLFLIHQLHLPQATAMNLLGKMAKLLHGFLVV